MKPEYIAKAEFIGDSVLNLVVRDYVFKLPKLSLRQRFELCSKLCSNEHLKIVCEKFIIKPRWFRGKKRHGDHIEFVIFQVFESQGFSAAKEFVEKIVLHPDLISVILKP